MGCYFCSKSHCFLGHSDFIGQDKTLFLQILGDFRTQSGSSVGTRSLTSRVMVVTGQGPGANVGGGPQCCRTIGALGGFGSCGAGGQIISFDGSI